MTRRIRSRTPLAVALTCALAAVISVVVEVALAGCSILPLRFPHLGASSTPAATDSRHAADGTMPASRFATTPGTWADRFATQSLHWSSCGTHTDCATFTAPLDWWHDTGSTVSVFLARHRATGSRLGSLVMDPGGPGGSGADAVLGGVDGVVTPEVARHYDVIGLDPRGVGESTAVSCGGTSALDDLLYGRVTGTIGSAQWISGARARAQRFAAACRAQSGDLLDHIDGLSVARDLELLREVLHEPKLNYLGYSYGSYLGTLYAGMYPTHVGRLVLDGVMDPWNDDTGNDDSGSGSDGSGSDDGDDGFGDAYNAFLDDCLAGKADAVGSGVCPFTGDRDAARSATGDLLVRLRQHPLRVGSRQLTDAVMVTAIDEALYSQSDWPRLAAAITAARAGSGTKAMRLADEYNGRDSSGYYDNSSEAFIAVNCLEYGSSIDLKADKKALNELISDDPLFGPYNAYGDLVCDGWNVGPSAFPAPIHADSAGPILLVGTTGDPATPYDDAQALAKQLGSAHLVTYDGEGHTAYDLGHSCVDGAVDAYLLRGTVPAKDPDCT